jgi:A/G-specific adenine glycosylase
MNSGAFTRRLLRWYGRHQRILPWRISRGDACHPYYVLLSEFMLQQTQVSTVLPYFESFLRRFPTLERLADASEQEVLQLWQGLGYYSRARNLLAAAKQIATEHRGIVPRDVPSLLTLPGIGRYTAGAIASIAFVTRAPILDGNVARVLARIYLITEPVQDRNVQNELWRRAGEILPSRRCGDFNSALMELGATVCTPRAPKCMLCPVQPFCKAFAAGMQERIPPPRVAKPSPLELRRTFCLARGKGRSRRWLIEQRPTRGRWASMWQFVTATADATPVTADTVHAIASVKSETPRRIGLIEHTLSHRRYRFEVYLCHLCGPDRPRRDIHPRRWVRLDELHRYPLPRPHTRIAEILRQLP